MSTRGPAFTEVRAAATPVQVGHSIDCATRRNGVWIYDFVQDRVASGTALKWRRILDTHTRECLAIEVARWIRSRDVILTLSKLMEI